MTHHFDMKTQWQFTPSPLGVGVIIVISIFAFPQVIDALRHYLGDTVPTLALGCASMAGIPYLLYRVMGWIHYIILKDKTYD